MYRQALQLRETVLGKDHPDTLMSMNSLASSLYALGKYAEAEAMHQQTLRLRETVLGKEHPDTLKSMMNLASSLYQQGKYVEAENLISLINLRIRGLAYVVAAPITTALSQLKRSMWLRHYT